MTLRAELLRTEGKLEAVRGQWDRLAVEVGAPFSAPGWMMPWWREVAPAGAGLRAATVWEGESMLGIAPLWVADPDAPSAHYEVLGARLAPPSQVLAEPGREAEVAAALAEALAAAAPRPALLRLEGRTETHEAITQPLTSSWPGASPKVEKSESVPMPMAHIGQGGYEEWLARRKGKFRGEARRRGRRLEEAGGRFAMAGPEDLDRALDAFFDLHAARWEDRGGSSLMVDGVRRMLVDAAGELLPDARLRVYTLEVEDRVACVLILAAAGEEAAGWGSGFDPAANSFAPAVQTILHSIEDAAARGQSRVNLGPGGQSYKVPMADAEDRMDVLKLTPRGRDYLVTRARMLGGSLHERLSR